ncbi:MAG: phosphatase PAP2 family protein [Candidatus Pacebacteria bacterium]|nr:phosphatase PAP2 family protein [Candidatus Paceibacterota bacterium]
METFMLIVTSIADPFPLALISAVFVLYLIYRGEYREAKVSAFAVIFGLISFSVIKDLLMVARPLHPMVVVYGSSFPSGHTTMVTILATLAVRWSSTRREWSNWRKEWRAHHWVLLAAVCLVLLVGFSRVYLGAHWSTDVVGGVALGLVSVLASLLFFKVM